MEEDHDSSTTEALPVMESGSYGYAEQRPAGGGFGRWWRHVGGSGLTVSLALHAALLFVAGFIVWVVVEPEKPIDFLPGGGSAAGEAASDAMNQKVQQKRRSTLAKSIPMQRLVSTSVNADLALPEVPMDSISIPDMASRMGGGAASGGFGAGGAGGGFGNGFGKGGMMGVTFKPIMMFGRELKDTKKIAVVMDVSRSMTKYLPAVVKELDKIARQSVLVLYFGCGVANPPKGRDIEDKVRKAAGEPFDCYWQNWEGKTPLGLKPEERKKLVYDPTLPMPLPDIYAKVSNRPNTFFVDFNGITYAWTALMSKEVMEADTIYWFADFQDKIDEEQAEVVRKKLKSRKQKLFMHASNRGRFFEQARDWMVTPLGGEVIEAEAK
jgi:hypothetical protein